LSLVATTAVMAVQDRVREHAGLQAIGYSGPRVFGLVLSEGGVVRLIGGVVGIGGGGGVVWWGRLAVGNPEVTVRGGRGGSGGRRNRRSSDRAGAVGGVGAGRVGGFVPRGGAGGVGARLAGGDGGDRRGAAGGVRRGTVQGGERRWKNAYWSCSSWPSSPWLR